MPDLTNIARKAQKKAPVNLQSLLGPLYYRYQSFRANQAHQNELTTSPSLDSESPNHVLIIVLDALRPDFVPKVAPLKFTRAVAPGTWTFPSVTSMQTGLLPHEHGSVAHTHPEDEFFALPKQYSDPLTLPALMENAGYETYLGSAFITPFLALQSWFKTHRVYGDVNAEKVLSDYQSWRQNHEKTYGYLQLGDLHAPINPPKSYVQHREVDNSLTGLNKLEKFTENYGEAPPKWREHRLRLYQAALDYVEDMLKPLIADIADDTLLVVIGDHGEAMWEHHERDRQFADSRPNYGVGHGGTPFDEVARVPVAFHHPNHKSEISGGLPSGKDIPTTICDGLGIDNHEFSGVSWFKRIPDSRYTICEATRYGTERKAIYQGNKKVIRSETGDVTLGATVREEGGEDFGTLSEETTSELVNRLPNHWDDMGPKIEASAMVQNRLNELGYL